MAPTHYRKAFFATAHGSIDKVIKGQGFQQTGLTSTCPQKEVNDHPASLGVMCRRHVESPAVFYFIERDYFYKSVATQIPHDFVFEPIPTHW